MCNIYAKARQVLLWLGREDYSTMALADYLVLSHRCGCSLPHGLNNDIMKVMATENINKATVLSGFQKLCDNAYWTRTWIALLGLAQVGVKFEIKYAMDKYSLFKYTLGFLAQGGRRPINMSCVGKLVKIMEIEPISVFRVVRLPEQTPIMKFTCSLQRSSD